MYIIILFIQQKAERSQRILRRVVVICVHRYHMDGSSERVSRLLKYINNKMTHMLIASYDIAEIIVLISSNGFLITTRLFNVGTSTSVLL